MGLRRTKMDENSKWASSEFASGRSLCPQHSVLSTIFAGARHRFSSYDLPTVAGRSVFYVISWL